MVTLERWTECLSLADRISVPVRGALERWRDPLRLRWEDNSLDNKLALSSRSSYGRRIRTYPTSDCTGVRERYQWLSRREIVEVRGEQPAHKPMLVYSSIAADDDPRRLT